MSDEDIGCVSECGVKCSIAFESDHWLDEFVLSSLHEL